MPRSHVKTYLNEERVFDLPEPLSLDTQHLIALPASIDPHVHFRTPGHERKEDWLSGTKGCVNAGVRMVFDMPNNSPSCTTYQAFQDKKNLISQQIEKSTIPIDFRLFFGADRNTLSDIPKIHDQAIAIKIFMGSSTGNLLIDDTPSLEKVFQAAAQYTLPIAVHAENETLILKEYSKHFSSSDYSCHSKIRSPQAAADDVSRAIDLAMKYGVKLYLLHISSRKELDIIRQAKQAGALLFVEATPHHLFLNTQAYNTLGPYALVNPPLREEEDRIALWEALQEGVIDVVGSDHAPHLSQEKEKPYPQSPSGMPGLETRLPLLVNACLQGKLSWKQVVNLTSRHIEDFFSLPKEDDWVIVDTKQVRTIQAEKMHCKAGWSPYEGWSLKGWPVAIFIKEQCFITTFAKEQETSYGYA